MKITTIHSSMPGMAAPLAARPERLPIFPTKILPFPGPKAEEPPITILPWPFPNNGGEFHILPIDDGEFHTLPFPRSGI